MQDYQKEQANILENQEEQYILKFKNSNGTFSEIRINENIRNRLEAFQNLNKEDDVIEMTNAPQFKKNVYESLQRYIDEHKSDIHKQSDSQKQQFSNQLQNIIGEKDYNIIISLKTRQDLIDLYHLAEFLMYNDLVDLLMTVMLFKFAGKSNQEIGEWLVE